jgi:hypothetical protein
VGTRDIERAVPHGRHNGIAPISALHASGETRMVDLVDIVIPASGGTAAEALGLKVYRSVTTGARVRGLPREEADIAVECLRDWGVSAPIVEDQCQD